MPPAGLGQASVDLVRLVRFVSFFFFCSHMVLHRFCMDSVEFLCWFCIGIVVSEVL